MADPEKLRLCRRPPPSGALGPAGGTVPPAQPILRYTPSPSIQGPGRHAPVTGLQSLCVRADRPIDHFLPAIRARDEGRRSVPSDVLRPHPLTQDDQDGQQPRFPYAEVSQPAGEDST